MNDQYQTPDQDARYNAYNMYGRVPQQPLPLESVYPTWVGPPVQHQYQAPEFTAQANAFDGGPLNMDVMMPFSFSGPPYLVPFVNWLDPTAIPGTLDLSLLSMDSMLPTGLGNGIPGYTLEPQPSTQAPSLESLDQIVFDPTAVPLPLDQSLLSGIDSSLVLGHPAERTEPDAHQRVTCVGCQLVLPIDDIDKHNCPSSPSITSSSGTYANQVPMPIQHGKNIKKHICPTCSKRFPNSKALRGHRARHIRPFQCRLLGCTQSFPQRCTLRNHHNNAHHMELQTLKYRFQTLWNPGSSTPDERLRATYLKSVHERAPATCDLVHEVIQSFNAHDAPVSLR